MIDIVNKSFFDIFTKSIRNRLLFKNKNFLAIICGETGSSKSYSALSFADIVSNRPISVARNVVFNPLEFMQRLNNSGGAKGMNLKKGDFLIFDEAGVGISSRDWYSIQNKLLGCVLQTFRNMNIGVIFTTPNLSFIDIQARKLFHYYLETDHIDFKRELAYLRTYELQHNSLLGKDYHKHPVCLDEHNRVITIQSIAVPKPRPDLIKEYEDAKTEFTKKLNEKVLNELKNPMASKMNEKMATVKEIERIRVEDFNKQVEVIKKDLDSYMSVNKRGNKGLDACKIQGKLNVVPSKARAIRDYILSNS